MVGATQVWCTNKDDLSLISLLERLLMKVEGVLDVSHRGYPVTTAFSLLNPGIGGIVCDIAAA